MTPLLEHPLIQKYFGFNDDGHEIGTRILKAMQEPIKVGESYLNFINQAEWILLNQCPKDIEGYHPWGLRLPSEHQPERDKEPTQMDRLYGNGCGCCSCHHDTTCRWHKKPSTAWCGVEGHNCHPEPETAKCNVFSHSVNCSGEPNHIVPNLDPVEEKIKEIIETPWHQTIQGSYRKALRELVELARVPPKNG